jgi:hypothetical protein
MPFGESLEPRKIALTYDPVVIGIIEDKRHKVEMWFLHNSKSL